MDGVLLSLIERICNLSVFLDLSLDQEALVLSVARNFRWDSQTTNALVTSRLDCCNVLFVGLTQKVQLAQNVSVSPPTEADFLPSCYTAVEGTALAASYL